MSFTINNSISLERQLVIYHLGNDEFGADIMNVKEIVRVPEITKVPNAPDYIEGVCNLRGSVLPIIDGRTKVGMEKKKNDEYSRILVIDINGKNIGMIVDRVSEVIRVNSADIEAPPSIIKDVNSDYLSGVVKLNEGNRLIMFLELSNVLRIENSLDMNQYKDDTDVNFINNETNKIVVNEEQLVSFLLGKEEYAFDIMDVKEIIRVSDIVEIPNSEDFIEGLVSYRNHLLPILNLRQYFNMETQEITEYTRILVVDTGFMTIGILVDKVSEVLRIQSNVIQPPPTMFFGSIKDQIKGIAKLNSGKRIIMILESSKLMQDENINSILELQGKQSNEEQAKSIEKQLLDEEQLVTFKIGAEEYGIGIDYVQEINRMTEITKIPRAPYFIEGIVNLRGDIIPTMDLRKMFGLPEKQYTDATRVVIIDFQGKKTGIVVDMVSEVLRFEKSLIEAPPQILSNGLDNEYIKGVGKLNQGKKMILIINLERLFSYNK